MTNRLVPESNNAKIGELPGLNVKSFSDHICFLWVTRDQELTGM